MSLGAFERPIHLMIEGHTNAAWPEKCLAHDPDQIYFLKVATQLWVDDAEVAAYLQSEYGLPVVVGRFNETNEDLPMGGAHTWTWQVENGEASTLTVAYDGENQNASSPYERDFWASANGGLVQLDLYPDEFSSITQMLSHGMMQPPTQFASDTNGVFAGLTRWYPQRAATGTFTVYSDTLCEKPVP